MEAKRMHPMKMIFSYFMTLRNSLVIIIFLFGIHLTDTSLFYRSAKWLMIAFLIWRVATVIIEWKNTTYRFSNITIHIRRGLFKKETSNIPIANIQNIQRKIPLYYKPFGVVFLALETNASGEHATVKLEAVSKSEAEWIEKQVSEPTSSPGLEDPAEQPYKKLESTRTIHYRPTKKDLWKASFISFSFLALIPVLLTVLKQADEIFHVDKTAESIWKNISGSYWWIGTIIFFLVIAAVAFGIIRTFLKYGNYEIAADDEYIYIRGGLLSERSFSIRKSRVQAVQILQPPWKRIFQLSEVKLVIAGSDDDLDLNDKEINSLYPYLPSDMATGLIKELLPQFSFTTGKPQRIPRVALKIRMLRPPWFWLAVTISIILFFRAYWYISPILFTLIYVRRYFSYRNTRFSFTASMMEIGQVGLWREQFFTSRKNLVEMEMSQSLFQKMFGLATIRTVNRAVPIHEETLEDVNADEAREWMRWYEERSEDIQLKT